MGYRFIAVLNSSSLRHVAVYLDIFNSDIVLL